MKLIPLKFAMAVGLAFSSMFFICNLFFSLAGNEASAWVMNVIFHEMDFKPLMMNSSFHLAHLFCGIGICFIAGGITGFITAITYNSISKRKIMEEQFSVFKKIIEEHVSFSVNKEEAPATINQPNPIGFAHK
ncbi:MAG TPA: DUF5676 family membrane protein [Bacteroidia bacterium]|nr:DUF5676 family membrane protein [Bacteroidia bacterium]